MSNALPFFSAANMPSTHAIANEISVLVSTISSVHGIACEMIRLTGTWKME